MPKYPPISLALALLLLACPALAVERGELEKSTIKAATDCVAQAALNNENIVVFYQKNRLKQVTDWIVLKSSACDNPLKAMRLLHDRIYGTGTGRRFLLGDYLNDLPRAVRERIKVEMARRNPDTLGAQADLPPPTSGANLRVIHIGANEILRMRVEPTENSPVVQFIPPNGTGIVYLGYTQGNWVFVQYERSNGWVERVFVEEIVPRGGKF
jgi:hypothetical protein